MGRVLALDVAFASMGWAIMEPDGDDWVCVDGYVIETKKSAKKRGIRVADDDARRSTELFATLSAICGKCGIKGIIAEMPPGGSQNATASKCLGMAKAIVACLAEVHSLPTEWITPDEGKIASTGKKGASKVQVQRGVLKVYPNCAKSFKLKQETKKAKLKRGSEVLYENRFEHTADAVAAFMAAKKGSLVRLLHDS